ncbi:hypothetical protein MTBUT4_20158 [Magnetospirillum sp. UT-4]|nr:hypothetical protein MTBUT4_20158 [Magnetospirillum sp. UT-4]
MLDDREGDRGQRRADHEGPPRGLGPHRHHRRPAGGGEHPCPRAAPFRLRDLRRDGEEGAEAGGGRNRRHPQVPRRRRRLTPFDPQEKAHVLRHLHHPQRHPVDAQIPHRHRPGALHRLRPLLQGLHHGRAQAHGHQRGRRHVRPVRR